MNHRLLNLALGSTAALFAIGAVAAPVVTLTLPLDAARSDIAPPARAKKTRVESAPTLESFSQLFTASLRPAVENTAAAPTSRPAAQTADAGVPVNRLELVGTVGTSLALVKGPDGTIAIVEPGDDVDGSAVVAIRRSQIDFRTGGRIVTLRMAPPPPDHVIVP